MKNTEDYKFKQLYPDKILNELKKHITKYVTKKKSKYPRFIFLCGKKLEEGKEKTNREWVLDFFRKRHKNVVCMLAESLWEQEEQYNIDLLTYENFLAEASDAIILILESFGTACELGAFTISETLIDKVYVFNYRRFKDEPSFINDGPIKKIRNKFSNHIVYIDQNAFFSNEVVYSKLEELALRKKEIKINTNSKEVKLNAFLIELLELISILGPIKQKDVINAYKKIKGFEERFEFIKEDKKLLDIPINHIFNMLVYSGLISKINKDYFTISDKINKINFMFNLDNLLFSSFRAKFLARKYKYDKKSILEKYEVG